MNGQTFLESSPELAHTWTALVTQCIFIGANALALVPSLLIIVAVVGHKRMRTVDNLVVLQISVVDAFYATMTLTWFPIKMAMGPSVLTYTACQLEGAVSVLCKVTWLYSATVCAFWRYYTIVHGGGLEKRSVLMLQLSQWGLPLVAALAIAGTGRFDLMPSGAYCYTRYRTDDWVLLTFYYVNIVVIFVPTCLAVYFYYAITAQFHTVVQRVSECTSNNQLMDKESCATNNKVDQLRDNPSLAKYRAVAFRSILYCVIFLLAFLPFGITMITELILDESRSAIVDCIAVSAIMTHKVLSPVVTLLINASIRAQVNMMLGL
ncbi:G-protein coupled receptor 84 [Entomophthora muscae]|uniref:G-protein coupled receptor 84 n=2 Tax=Entomophthora muscae TaxID=34485 RepID=A0ACC2TI81_9FUNG|nr:G-protein coupled receptor 84 [Entomophthora muscae]KAJ9079013.1 G-protein coupled receptor 84 [Entomophthora muscae]